MILNLVASMHASAVADIVAALCGNLLNPWPPGGAPRFKT